MTEADIVKKLNAGITVDTVHEFIPPPDDPNHRYHRPDGIHLRRKETTVLRLVSRSDGETVLAEKVLQTTDPDTVKRERAKFLREQAKARGIQDATEPGSVQEQLEQMEEKLRETQRALQRLAATPETDVDPLTKWELMSNERLDDLLVEKNITLRGRRTRTAKINALKNAGVEPDPIVSEDGPPLTGEDAD